MKRVPLRMCVGCGEMKDKRELTRVVKSKEGEISLDLTGKKAGRGAYVCPSLECLDVYKRQTYSPSMIKDAIQAAKDIVDGKDVSKDNIIPPTIVTKDNVSTVLDANSPY